MGASVSICNLTPIILNIAIKHASPLHYQNMVIPGDCFNVTTGRVWYTVEAKVWMNGSNNYNDEQVSLPIAGAALIAPVIAALGLVPVANNRGSDLDTKSVAMAAAVAASPGIVTSTAGIISNIDSKTPKRWKVSKTGVYMKTWRVIAITGGPKYIKDSWFAIDSEIEHEPLIVEIVD